MNYRVSEIYRAIQGEGWHAGLPCTIVRLQGCNLRCEFCDTKYAQDPKGGAAMTIDEIYAEIDRVCHRKGDIVLITGGEPTLQDLMPLAQALRNLGPIHLETNGTQYMEALAIRLDWVTVSPKPPNPCDQNALLMSDEIKWLVGSRGDVETLKEFLTQPVLSYGKPKCVSVQPISMNQEATEIAYQACLKYGWRLSIQLHKIIGVK